MSRLLHPKKLNGFIPGLRAVVHTTESRFAYYPFSVRSPRRGRERYYRSVYQIPPNFASHSARFAVKTNTLSKMKVKTKELSPLQRRNKCSCRHYSKICGVGAEGCVSKKCIPSSARKKYKFDGASTEACPPFFKTN